MFSTDNCLWPPSFQHLKERKYHVDSLFNTDNYNENGGFHHSPYSENYWPMFQQFRDGNYRPYDFSFPRAISGTHLQVPGSEKYSAIQHEAHKVPISKYDLEKDYLLQCMKRVEKILSEFLNTQSHASITMSSPEAIKEEPIQEFHNENVFESNTILLIPVLELSSETVNEGQRVNTRKRDENSSYQSYDEAIKTQYEDQLVEGFSVSRDTKREHILLIEDKVNIPYKTQSRLLHFLLQKSDQTSNTQSKYLDTLVKAQKQASTDNCPFSSNTIILDIVDSESQKLNVTFIPRIWNLVEVKSAHNPNLGSQSLAKLMEETSICIFDPGGDIIIFNTFEKNQALHGISITDLYAVSLEKWHGAFTIMVFDPGGHAQSERNKADLEDKVIFKGEGDDTIRNNRERRRCGKCKFVITTGPI